MAEKINRTIQRVERRLLKKWNVILGFFIGLFGINGVVSCAYGCPPEGCSDAKPSFIYDVKGTVRASDTKNPISGIQIKPDSVYLGNPVLAAGDGSFVWDSTAQTVSGPTETIITLIITDVDGSVNGSFVTKNVSITITSSDYAGKSNVITKNIDIEIDPVN
jgi:putative lipoprotein (rSAM/lipoprotein system)